MVSAAAAWSILIGCQEQLSRSGFDWCGFISRGTFDISQRIHKHSSSDGLPLYPNHHDAYRPYHILLLVPHQ